MAEEVVVKRKKYTVDVESKVKATMVVFANSKAEAVETAESSMAESLKRKIDEAAPHELVFNVSGKTKAFKNSVKLIQA